MAQIKNDAITRQEDDFAQWYTDVCRKAKLMDYASTKGFIVYLPDGYALWEGIKNYLDKRFKEEVKARNVYLPLIIPSSLFNKEKEHVEGFAPETLVATIGGGKKLEDPLVIRPTSEVLFSDLYRKILSSYRDLPLIYNQWCSVVRWEKTTRPFLRGAEFLWQEGHCLFASKEEAVNNVLQVLDIYDRLGKELLAIPFLKGRKTEREKFAGAVDTFSIEALMPDGKALQAGTTHYLGQGFAEAFGISYQGKNNALEIPHQTSWGVSTRLIGALIMCHGDDNGLVLPPAIAPIQVAIVPIRASVSGVMETARSLEKTLSNLGVRTFLYDDESKTPGYKFAELEMKGIPLRLEIGPKDLEKGEVSLTIRFSSEKRTLPLSAIATSIPSLLQEIQTKMYERAEKYRDQHITEVNSLEELKEVLDRGGYALMAHDGEEETELKIKELTNGGTARCIKEDIREKGTLCPISGKEAKYLCYFAKAY